MTVLVSEVEVEAEVLLEPLELELLELAEPLPLLELLELFELFEAALVTAAPVVAVVAGAPVVAAAAPVVEPVVDGVPTVFGSCASDPPESLH